MSRSYDTLGMFEGFMGVLEKRGINDINLVAELVGVFNLQLADHPHITNHYLFKYMKCWGYYVGSCTASHEQINITFDDYMRMVPESQVDEMIQAYKL
jgi:hypothetical protein